MLRRLRLPQAPARPANAKPVVVLDPGHGGVDPGTSSATGITEKEVVLTFARALKSQARSHRPLRGAISPATTIPSCRCATAWSSPRRKAPASSSRSMPIISPSKTDKATGATVYTLSEEASDEEARALAAKENFSDALAGIELPSDSDEVLANILIDLAQRETQNRSAVFARSIVGELAAQSAAAYPKDSDRRDFAC